MRNLLTSNLRVKFLGLIPLFKEKDQLILNPQQIVSLSALTTFKGKSIKRLFEESKAKGEDLNKKTIKILQKSSLRGHASIATTPAVCISYEASKFLDSALTGIVFSSSLMASGRRTDTTEKDIVYPEAISKNKKAKKIYYDISKKLIDVFNELLANGVIKDEASKLLQYGIYGTGIINLPIESIISLKRECEKEKEWMPEEVGFLLTAIEKKLKGFGLNLLYGTRLAAPRNTYPYPNIFKDPKKVNIVRELAKSKSLEGSTKIVSSDIFLQKGLKEKFSELNKKIKKTFSSLIRIKKDWYDILADYQDIFRDYNPSLRLRILSSVAWRVWGEKKRHRTVPMVSESIYFCVDRTVKVFKKYSKEIRNFAINPHTITSASAGGAKMQDRRLFGVGVSDIEKVFSIPPTIKGNQEYLGKYLLTALESFEAYTKLLKLGIKERDAVFLIPRGVKIDVLQEYDFYNLITGYYSLRLCSTADEELRRKTLEESVLIKKLLKRKDQSWLADFIAPKCQLIGFCPEEKSCGYIKSRVKAYNEDFHQQMKDILKQKFEENLKNLGK